METLIDAILQTSVQTEIQTSETLIQEAISKLPKDQQEVIFYRYGKQLSVKEISELLGFSVTTIYQKLNRSLFTLRNKFNPSAYKRMYEILYPETRKPESI
jgi:RNA polymerase sigma factor (sigma-70 family)